MRTGKRVSGGILITTEKYGEVFIAIENNGTDHFYKELGTPISSISAEAGYQYFNIVSNKNRDKSKSLMYYTPDKYANNMLYFIPFLAGLTSCRPTNLLYSLESLASFYVNKTTPVKPVSEDSFISKNFNLDDDVNIMQMLNLPEDLDAEEYKKRAFLDDMTSEPDIDAIIVELLSDSFTDEDMLFYSFLTLLNSVFFAGGEHNLNYQL